MFHASCFNTWKASGGTTCPMCRDHLKKSLYRIHVKIENLETEEVTTHVTERRVGAPELDNIDRAEIIFEVDQLQEIQELIDGGFFGVTRSDFDTTVFNTE
jgi:hypothetical protein